MRLLLDTNVLLRAAQPSHPQHNKAIEAVEDRQMKGDEYALLPQVLYEYWVVATRPISVNGLGMSIEQVRDDLIRLEKMFLFYPDSVKLYDLWKSLIIKYRVQGKPAHDTRLVAGMIHYGITDMLTFNAVDFRRYEEITVHEIV